MQSIAEYYRVLQRITEYHYHRVLQGTEERYSVTEYYRVLPCVTECIRVLQRIKEYYRVL